MNIGGQLSTSRNYVISEVINIERTFFMIISDSLSISDVKLNLSNIFRNFQNGRHFEVRVIYKPEVILELESYIKIDPAIPYISSF